MTKVMLDLETMGNGSNAPIVAIGAVEFDEDSGEVGRDFYRRISLESSVALGTVMDPSTVLWWLQQADAARAELTNQQGRVSIEAALTAFDNWIDATALVWGNGADFDNVILANTYRAAGGQAPWKFYHNRCYRTLKNLMPEVPFARAGTAHNALDDAKSQAVHAIALLRKLKGV